MLEGLVDCPHAIRPLRVARASVVLDEAWMRDKERWHRILSVIVQPVAPAKSAFYTAVAKNTDPLCS